MSRFRFGDIGFATNYMLPQVHTHDATGFPWQHVHLVRTRLGPKSSAEGWLEQQIL